MLYINKMTPNNVIDFAAEELKKYLRMMMPEEGDVKIVSAPEREDGFRLGLMQDFGLDVSDAEDLDLDDILYIDCNEQGGIISGDNPRSVLLAVYEYLRQNGCCWLYPGIDGEYIPMKNIDPVKYRHKPAMRYRGQCNEGAESQQCMMAAIDFAPKLGMNVFMLEFRIPTAYYSIYYNHLHNEKNRPPEPVTKEQVFQWKRMCESEISKRGLQFHDIGHGWSVDPFGIDSSLRSSDGDNDARLTDEQREQLALVGGRRGLIKNTPSYTQFCMGSKKARDIVSEYVADYAEKHSNTDFLHVWLGDSVNSQCECDLCREKTPSDWYVILLNEIDEKLTARGLSARIAFISYVDTIWPPVCERLNNPKRFILLFAPITRSYTKSVPSSHEFDIAPYTRNTLVMPNCFGENLAYLEEWKKRYAGDTVAFEYHFWRHQYYDVSGIEIAKRVSEDIKEYKKRKIIGMIEDGTQRSYFPNGLAFYTYARTMFDTALDFEAVKEEYLSHAYGEDWREFVGYLEELGNVFGFAYLEGEESSDEKRSPYYSPERADALTNIEQILSRGQLLIRSHYNSPVRVQTVSVRLLERHAEYLRQLSKALSEKAKGNDEEADRLIKAASERIGSFESEIELYYDHTLAFHSWDGIFSARTKSVEPIIY